MAYMTEEEAEALAEEMERIPPKVDFSKPDIFLKQRELLSILKPATADYIITRALATHRTPVQIISELVDARIAAAV